VYQAYGEIWDKATIDHNVLNLVKPENFFESSYRFDAKSIMCYKIHKMLLLEEYRDKVPSNTRNNKLSADDKRKCREVYPLPLRFYNIGCEVRVKSSEVVKEDYSVV
jgi:hypothetical protein